MRFLGLILGCVCMALLNVGCSDSDTTAGIEIGNPELASRSIGFTADFSVDYSDAKQVALTKSASDNEDVVIDTFRLTLSEVRSFCSFYVGLSIPPEVGLVLWPYEDNGPTVLPISFTEGEVVKEAFKNINLQNGGRLKEIRVSFEVEKKDGGNAIYGHVKKDGKMVPFVYKLSYFQNVRLKYHISQVDILDSIINLSVVFRAHRFVDGVDFESAEVDADGVIRINNEENVSIWEALNKRFIKSFQSLSYEFDDVEGHVQSGYVDDVLSDLNAVYNKNLVTNGDFKGDENEWIFLTQFGGAGNMLVVKENNSNVVQVNVTRGGNYSYSVQLLHENISLLKGAKYKFIFTIWSNIETTITARMGSYITYKTNGLEEHVPVKKTGRSFEKEFVAEETDPLSRLDLNLGGKEATFWIKDVQIIRIK